MCAPTSWTWSPAPMKSAGRPLVAGIADRDGATGGRNAVAFDVTLQLPDAEPDLNPAFVVVAGVSVLSRLILGAAAAGAQAIAVCGAQAEAAERRFGKDARLQALDLRWGGSIDGAAPLVRVRADVVVGKAVWTLLAAANGPVEVPGAPVMKRMADGDSRPLWTGEAPAGAYVVPIAGEEDAPRAKRVIFANVTKPTSGPVSRHLNARLSIPISKVLCELGVTPNQMTIFTTLLGLVSVWFMAKGTLIDLAIGGLLFQTCAALDRVDGELARSMFMASEHGAWIDTIGDNLVYVAMMLGLNLGYYRYGLTQGWAHVDWIPLLGAGMVAFSVLLISGMAWYLHANDQPGTMTAVQRDLATKIEAAEVGWTYRVLDSIKVIGKRDSFSLIGFVLTTLPLLTGWAGGYHLLVGFVDVGVVLVGLYYAIGLTQARAAA